MNNLINVSSEIGNLQRLLVHRPDSGIGKIAPSMKDTLLYDDIVFLEKMQEEYREYLQVLMWFLDPMLIKGIKDEELETCFNPASSNFINSDKVIDVQYLIIKLLENKEAKNLLVASVCAIENCDFQRLNTLLNLEPTILAEVLITGVLIEGKKEVFLFPPIPNLIFTRDIGIVINDHLLLSRPAEIARSRESILTKYIAYYVLFGSSDKAFSDKIIELKDREMYLLSDANIEDEGVTIEGGDVMMISKRHLIVGKSVRTSAHAIDALIRDLFNKNVVDKVSVVSIPPKRDYMHIDTVFTMVKKNLWVVFGPFSGKALKEKQSKFNYASKLTDENAHDKNVHVTQFLRIEKDGKKNVKINKLGTLEELFKQVSVEDYNVNPKDFDVIYCAGDEFPYREREQWTDACNFLALKDGVIIGYDRNVKTEAEFNKRGFKSLKTCDFIAEMKKGKSIDEVISGDTIILLPSSELSRARGGTHCMSMPILRQPTT